MALKKVRKKICVVTGSRAEFGLLLNLMREIDADAELKLQTLVTGSHLSPEFGLTWKEITSEGIRIDRKVEMILSSDTPSGIAKSVGLGLIGFADAFRDLKPDIVIILGDRFEILAAAISAMLAGITIAHIHGGELTEGAYDDAIRHAVTKLSSLHFTSTEVYRRRVIQLGENPDNVFNVGALCVDSINTTRFVPCDILNRDLGIEPGRRTILVTYHPATAEKVESSTVFNELLAALEDFPDLNLIFTKANADADGRIINEMIDDFSSRNSERAKAFASLGRVKYLSVMKCSVGVVGNSSSGIIEAPCLGIGTVNIGSRQDGRIRGTSIIDVNNTRRSIAGGVRELLSDEFIKGLTNLRHDYGKPGVSKTIVKILRERPLSEVRKKFYDIPLPGALAGTGAKGVKQTSITVIAEAGVNHNGSLNMAFELVDAARGAGADFIKYQTFNADKLATKFATKANYQKLTTAASEPQHEMLKKLELSREDHCKVLSYCREKGISFLTSAFDIDSLKFVVSELKLPTLKIPSGEITNAPLLLEYGQSGKDLILSTGMSTIGEVELALGILAFGLLGHSNPGREGFLEAFYSTQGQAVLKKKVSLLHCATEYPASFDLINLNALSTLKSAFGLRTGYSDHTMGIIAPVVAVAKGATIIEKHITIDRTMPGPDHSSSLEPSEFSDMVKAIKSVPGMLGNGVKLPIGSEIGNRNIVRCKLVASRRINKGEMFTVDNIGISRSTSGGDPMEYWKLLNSLADRNYEEGAPISG